MSATCKPETYAGRACLPKSKVMGGRDLRLRREAMTSLYNAGDALWGTDGFRVHAVHGEDFGGDNEENVDLHFPLEECESEMIEARAWPQVALLTAYALPKACQIALSLNKANHKDNPTRFLRDVPFPIRLHFTPEGLHMAAFKPEVGIVRFTLSDGLVWKLKVSEREHIYDFRADAEHDLYIQPKFLADATQSIEGEIVIRLNPEKRSIYLADEEREHEALIMCLEYKNVHREFVKKDLA